MFAINFNFPYRKKDGSLVTMEKALDGAGADLDLIDLDDVAIIDPAEGDGLIYDNTAHKWKNIPIISRILTLFNAWKKNGAYNLCPNEATTQVVNGVTYTVNADGTISTSGATTTNTSQLTICNVKLPKGTYKAVGCPIGGSSNPWTYYVIYKKDNASGETLGYDEGNGCTLTLATDTVVDIGIIVNTNIDMSGKVFKPMITTDLNATYADYVPHAMTNRELTEKKQYNVTTSITSSNATVQVAFIAIRKGTMVNLYGYVQANTSITAGSNITGTFSGMPKPLWPCTSATFSATMTFCANLGIDGAFTVRVPANISNEQSIFLNFTYATEDLI